MTSDNRIAALAKMSAAQKRAEWRRLTGQPAPPAFGSGMLTRAIAHAFQDKAAGSAGKALQRRLKRLGDRATRGDATNASLEIKPGTWLSRTWHGEVHQVVVLETGFEYRSERYPSLTAIALHITGAAWSGPRFFGLASPRLSKLDVTRGG